MMVVDCRRWVIVAVALWLAGCSQVVSATPEEVRINTDWLGEIAPGTRVWLSWLKANEHCAAHGRKPEIADFKGEVAIYKCVDEKK